MRTITITFEDSDPLLKTLDELITEFAKLGIPVDYSELCKRLMSGIGLNEVLSYEREKHE
jgi:hypothetical protein